MIAILGSLLSGLASGVLAPVLGFFTSKETIALQGFTTAAGIDKDVAIATLNAQVQVAQLRASQNMWWGARLITLMVAGTAGLHFAAVMLDSVPLAGHVVGAWGVPKLPAPYDTDEWALLQTFFIVTPAAPVLSAITAWFHRA